jgi:protein-tyrosine phosphatase
MDDYNVADLKRLVFDEDLHKVRKLLSFAGETGDIADPWYTSNFQITYDDVHRGCRHLLEVL